MNAKPSAARTVSPSAVLNPRRATPLSAEDRLDIHELIARYCLVLDNRDESHVAKLLTSDARQEHPVFGVIEGQHGFAALLREHPEFLGAIRHQAVNIATARTGPHSAEAVHYTIVTQVHALGGASPTPLPRLFAHGVVHDQLVRQDGRWLIHRRAYDQMSLAPDHFPEDQRQAAGRRRTPAWGA